MSADLVLIAAPADQAWLDKYRLYSESSHTLFGDEDDIREDEYLDDQRRLWMRGAEDLGYGFLGDDWTRLREELGIDALPYIWIGQVSWLKSGLTGEPELYVPGAVRAVARLHDESRILTPGLAKATTVALNHPNRSIYGKAHTYYAPDRKHISGRARELAPGVYRVRKPAHNRIYNGVAPARRVKNWLNENLGARIIHESW